MLGRVLRGRYEVLRGLGSGGFGEVFLARDRDLPGEPFCVVKVLKLGGFEGEFLGTARRLFEREATVLYGLGGCDFVPRLLAHFEENGEFFLVEEFVEGGDLRGDFALGKRWDVDVVWVFLVEVLGVLRWLHEQNVIHRDLKPANLIRRKKDGRLVLIDFGAVKEVLHTSFSYGVDENEKTIIGTPGYVSPEQARGEPNFNSDIYALGMMAIQALTGILPHFLPEDPLTKEKLWRNRLDNIVGESEFLEVIDKMVRYDFRERYQSAAEVLADLGQINTQSLANLQSNNLSLKFEKEPEMLTLPSQIPPVKRGPVLLANSTDYRHRQILINKVTNFWIKGVLESSLHGRAMIELGLESRLDLIERPWGIVWGNLGVKGDLLPSGVRVSDKFLSLGEGRSLLILGEPGAGKTTTLLQLARDLLQEAQGNTSCTIPVVFNLSSWNNPKQSLADWLIAELKTQYQVSSEIARRWIVGGELLLLLDGLDEVSVKLQDACVSAINRFYQEHGTTELVVCSRIKDYQSLQNRLQLQDAICLQPLTLQQIDEYLHQASELTGLKAALQQDNSLQELAHSPLMLSIMTLAYRGMPAQDLLSVGGIEERRQHLFNAYIERMLNHRSRNVKYSKKQTIYWLSWLAQSLSKQSQTVFFIEKMQPILLTKKRQKLTYVLSLLLVFFTVGGAVGYVLLPKTQLPLALMFGAGVFWLIFGVDKIEPVETLQWSWKKAGWHLVLGVLLGGLLLFPFKIVYESFLALLSHKMITVVIPDTPSLGRGIIFGMSLGLVYGLIQGFKGAAIQRKTFPNQGIIQSGQNSLFFATIGFCLLGLPAKLLEWDSLVWQVIGLLFGFAAGGEEACIKHFILRIILCASGVMPWNYSRFLDYAVRKIFLQKVGGGYIFVHRLLLEHFAAINFDQKPVK